MEIVIPYEPRRDQLALHEATARWMVTICHRRFGKTVYAINKLIKANFTNNKKNPRYAYIAPFMSQAKSIAWDYIKEYSRVIPNVKINEAELRIDYPNGGRIRLYGADNPDALRGNYFDGVVLDEYAQIHPQLFSEVLRPALSDRKGWCEFMGTPKGRNHFYDLYMTALKLKDWTVNVFKASETGVVDEDELQSARDLMTPDQFDQEYECSFTAAVQGAYYADIISKLHKDKRICSVPIEPSIPINTFWDLGRNDTTAIWFHQYVGREHRFIDFYENNGEGLTHYASVLREKGYLYGDHYLPHDVEVTELTTNLSRRETLESLGVDPIEVVPRVRDINEGIEMTRQLLTKCVFDELKCSEGLRALENYRKDYDEKRQVFRARPLHDWCSNPADAIRQCAQGFEPMNDAYSKPAIMDYSHVV